MAEHGSFQQLINQLCEEHLGPVKRVNRVQPTLDRDCALKRLKKKAHNALFSYLDDREEEGYLEKSGVGLIENVMTEVDRFHTKGQHKDAEKLTTLFDALSGTQSDMLRFLVALRGCGDAVSPPILGQGVFGSVDTKSVSDKQLCKSHKTDSGLWFELSDNVAGASRTFSVYPSMMFDSVSASLETRQEKRWDEIFSLNPGSGLWEGSFFKPKFLLDDDYEKTTYTSLFGGLVQAKVEDINVTLTLPDLTQHPYIKIPELKTKKSVSVSQLSEESGVVSGSTSMSSSVTTLCGHQTDQTYSNIWLNALTEERSYHYTWEWIGYAPGPTEKPHLTEAGPNAFDLLVQHRRKVLAMFCSTLKEHPPVPLVTLTSDQLIKNILLMLIGVPTPFMIFDKDCLSFRVHEGVHVSGISPEMLANFLTDFLDCGTFYSRLQLFSQPPDVTSSFYTKGLVFQAFTSAIRKILSQFKAAVLNTPHDVGLIEFKVHLHKAMEQIKYLAVFCHCDNSLTCKQSPQHSGQGVSVTHKPFPQESGDAETDRLAQTSVFPTGIKLLTYVYDEANNAVNSCHYPLLLSILQTTCAPFVLFIRDWIFYGVLRDSCGEFMIKVNTTSLSCRDKEYWSSAYSLDTQSPVPNFLQDIVEEMVICGKSINLLRLCNPDHFMCNISEREIPSMNITYSQHAMRVMNTNCQIYVARMTQVSRKLTDDRAEMMRKAEEARIELLETARRVVDQEKARIEGLRSAHRAEKDAKKRVEFARLKSQMVEDLKRRAGETQTEKEEDKNLVARITREEDALTEDEIELERQAREEIIEYYASLGEEAAQRERLALWKIQRARLSLQRENFLEKDAERWSLELARLQNSMLGPVHVNRQEVIDGVSIEQGGQSDKYNSKVGSHDELIHISDMQTESNAIDQTDSTSSGQDVILPRWVQRHGGADSVVRVTGEEDVTLPAWAARELPPLVEEQEETIPAEIKLPHWVLREADDSESAENDIIEESYSEGSVPEEQIVTSKTESEEEVSNQSLKNSLKSTACNKLGHEARKHFERQLRAVQIGGSPLPKPHVKTSSVSHATKESEEVQTKPSTRMVQGKLATDETIEQELVKRPHIKIVPGSNSYEQTEECGTRPHVKASATMAATKESEPEESSSHLKFVDGVQVNQQSVEEMELVPRRAKQQGQASISTESVPQVWVIKKPSMFGHASQLSGLEYVLTVPKLKRQFSQHANKESSLDLDFGIKPRIRMNRNMHATKQSSEVNENNSAPRSRIKMVKGRGSSVESESVDDSAVSRHRFMSRNTKGHASDSSVQKLIYGDNHKADDKKETDYIDGPINICLSSPPEYEPLNLFMSEFPSLETSLSIDVMSNVAVADLGHDLVDPNMASEEEISAYTYTPLSILLARSLTAPIKAQFSLVTSAVINYFTSDLRIDDHFVAMRRYLLMGDGDFSEILANILFEKLSTNPRPQEIFNPMFLNTTLRKAVCSSIYSDDKYLNNLSFDLTHIPSVLLPNDESSLSCLELRYSVPWPLNIILTTRSMAKYNTIFKFLLQIKRVVWILKDVWHHLKRDALVIKGVTNSSEFRQIQLFRQEMEFFVKAMQGYITNQLIHVSWQEFQSDLAQAPTGLLDLKAKHTRYIDKALSRCLLDKKAKNVMKCVQDILRIILKFRAQLVFIKWRHTESGGVTHPNFDAIKETHNSFHRYSFFLFKVLHRLSLKGYQPQVQELLLQLNFNDYYKDVAA